MKYAILLVILLAAYGISMAVMWSRYEPRDVRVEFPSDFREGLVKLVPDITFLQIPPGDIRDAQIFLSGTNLEIPDPETFLILANHDKSIVVTAGEVAGGSITKVRGRKILVQYLQIKDLDNDYIILSHSDFYDWPGRNDHWTTTHLSYDGGDFHYDNKSSMWLETWVGFSIAVLVWLILWLKISDFTKPKRSQ